MITEYYRPKTIEEALILIARPNTVPLGGGTVLNQPQKTEFAVVDLQALNLNHIRKNDNHLEIGASVTLQSLLESKYSPTALVDALKLEDNINRRQIRTVAGTLVACNGRSTFTTIMLSLDANLILMPGEQELSIGNLLPVRKRLLQGKLITKIIIPFRPKIAFKFVSRTPSDRPIVCVAVTQWSSGRIRLAVGGFGDEPILAIDGNETGGIDAAARNTFQGATDAWGSAEYRMEMASILAMRCLYDLAQ